jgi:hypothetical protein
MFLFTSPVYQSKNLILHLKTAVVISAKKAIISTIKTYNSDRKTTIINRFSRHRNGQRE